jgi:glycolate oxidase FAD binding subunit
MSEAITPKSEKDLVSAIEWAIAEEAPLEVVGAGTKRGLGRAIQTRATLDMRNFAGVVVYEPEELILEAGAATPLAELEALLEARGQQFAFEPPDYSRVLGAPHSGTLGGMISCNLAGPRRLKAGAARDHVLAISGVSGRGEAFKSGARVVKNVTGYDLPKLMTGAWGTLAALTTITVKVLPRAETEESFVLSGLTPEQAVTAMSLAMQSSCEVSAAAHVPADLASSLGHSASLTLLRLEGIPPSIAYRRDKLAALLKQMGAGEIMAEAASRAAWRAIRDVHPLADASHDRCLWKISVPPMQGARLLAAVPGSRGYLDWAGGLVWLETPAGDDGSAAAVRTAAGEGHATLFRAPAHLRSTTDVFHPQDPALAALSQRVKQSFDPKAVLNPGRMYRGV